MVVRDALMAFRLRKEPRIVSPNLTMESQSRVISHRDGLAGPSICIGRRRIASHNPYRVFLAGRFEGSRRSSHLTASTQSVATAQRNAYDNSSGRVVAQTDPIERLQLQSGRNKAHPDESSVHKSDSG